MIATILMATMLAASSPVGQNSRDFDQQCWEEAEDTVNTQVWAWTVVGIIGSCFTCGAATTNALGGYNPVFLLATLPATLLGLGFSGFAWYMMITINPEDEYRDCVLRKQAEQSRSRPPRRSMRY